MQSTSIAGPTSRVQPLSAIDLARQRFSCRRYLPRSLSDSERRALEAQLSAIDRGPLGAGVRFRLIAATDNDAGALRGLGTYGFIKDAPAFIVGAVATSGSRNLEDYGYATEQIVLAATGMSLGTCWLGGSFAKTRFARAIAATPSEAVPAVVAIGHPADGAKRGLFRRAIGAFARLPWSALFFDEAFGKPLTEEQAGRYAPALETLRIGPSASNKQPWRIVRQGQRWHFYLRRTASYRQGSFWFRVFKMADLQRLDMGIAMCHFELAAQECALGGRWVIAPPTLDVPDRDTEYAVTWLGD